MADPTSSSSSSSSVSSSSPTATNSLSQQSNPIEPTPRTALFDSYTYHSPLPSLPGPSSKSDKPNQEEIDEEEIGEGWMMGIDEAGRGPVLGPMVYAAAYCPLSFKDTLEGLGFDDSKALSVEKRDQLWNAFTQHPPLCYTSNIISPQDISKDMLKKVPFNLNRQAEESTISLIRDALDRGVHLTECYVDALGPAPQWQARLSAIFPAINFTVKPKADSLYKIVGAASIIAKVTRDRWIEHWIHPESPALTLCLTSVIDEPKKGKGKRKVSKKKVMIDEGEEEEEEEEEDETEGSSKNKRARLEASRSMDTVEEEELLQREEKGSGYPSDPKTQAYLKAAFHPVFGYPSVVRFSWSGIKVAMEKDAVGCKWVDEVPAQGRLNFFDSGSDNTKPKLWKELGLVSVGEL